MMYKGILPLAVAAFIAAALPANSKALSLVTYEWPWGGYSIGSDLDRPTSAKFTFLSEWKNVEADRLLAQVAKPLSLEVNFSSKPDVYSFDMELSGGSVMGFTTTGRRFDLLYLAPYDDPIENPFIVRFFDPRGSEYELRGVHISVDPYEVPDSSNLAGISLLLVCGFVFIRKLRIDGIPRR